MARSSDGALVRVGCALSFALLLLAAAPARAGLYSLSASGTISFNTSSDATIPVGTPWSLELVYDTAAPDLDFQLTGSADPTFGRFDNSGTIPALTFFHYRAGSYEVTVADPAEFAVGSGIDITFTAVHAIDINVNAPAFFPPLAGGAVSFHADFNDFSSRPIFTSDALPTDPALGPDSFDQLSVSLLPPSAVITGSSLTSFAVRAIPEPSVLALGLAGLLSLLVAAVR